MRQLRYPFVWAHRAGSCPGWAARGQGGVGPDGTRWRLQGRMRLAETVRAPDRLPRCGCAAPSPAPLSRSGRSQPAVAQRDDGPRAAGSPGR